MRIDRLKVLFLCSLVLLFFSAGGKIMAADSGIAPAPPSAALQGTPVISDSPVSADEYVLCAEMKKHDKYRVRINCVSVSPQGKPFFLFEWGIGAGGFVGEFTGDRLIEHDAPYLLRSPIAFWGGNSTGWTAGGAGQDMLGHSLMLMYENGNLRATQKEKDISSKFHGNLKDLPPFSEELVYTVFNDFAVTRDGSKAFAVGRSGEMKPTAKGKPGKPRGFIMALNNKTWHMIKAKELENVEQLNSVAISSDGSSGYAVGNKGTILCYDGKNWKVDTAVQQKELQEVNLCSVAMSGEGRLVFAVGSGGMMLMKTNNSWTRIHGQLAKDDLKSVSVSRNGERGFAVGYGATILEWDGTGWKRVNSLIPGFNTDDAQNGQLESVRVSPDGRCAWATSGKYILKCSDGKWVLQYHEKR